MARLDSFLAQLIAYEADALVVVAGDTLALTKGEQRVPLVQVRPGALTNAHVAALFAEVAPMPARRELEAGEPTAFDYALGNCLFHVVVTWEDDRLVGRVKDVPEAALQVAPGHGAAAESDVVEGEPVDEPALARLMKAAAALRASELHLVPGAAPRVRVDGEIGALPGAAALDTFALQSLVHDALPSSKAAELEALGETGFIFDDGSVRARIRVMREAGGTAAIAKVVARTAPSIAELGGADDVARELARLSQLDGGIVVVAGHARSGRTTTLAAMVRAINEARAKSIATVEELVECLHEPRRSIVHQREIGGRAKAGCAPIVRASEADVVAVDAPLDGDAIEAIVDVAEAGRLVLLVVPAHPHADRRAVVEALCERVTTDKRDRVRRALEQQLAAVVGVSLAGTPRRATLTVSARTPRLQAA